MLQNKNKVTIQGNNFCYYRQGEGETVLFVHGITTYSFMWRNIVPHFKNNDVVVIDLLGCGESDIPLTEDISLKRQTFLLKDFCDALGIRKMHLVCHDVGGGIGQIFAVNFPEYLYHLTLINTVAYNFWPVQPIIAMRTPILRQIAMATLDIGMFRLIVKRGLFFKERLTEDLMAYFYKPMKTSHGRKGFLHFARCLNNQNLTEIERKIRKLEMPVMIIRGDADVYLSASISEKLHNEILHSKLVKIASGGHFIQEDVPEKLAAYILSFMQSIRYL